ncbi:MAG: glycogen debranching protein [Ferruginibacter sp.]|nr:glycogen debranching protein [Ferruginibacter sp.]
MIKRIVPICFLFLVNQSSAQQMPIYQSEAFNVFADSVTQGTFTAYAKSDREIISNYQSPAYLFQSPAIIFKFSINCKDNEMKPGVDHRINCTGLLTETPLIKFGQQYTDTARLKTDQYLQVNSRLHIRVDMRHVFSDFKKQGYFTTYNGNKIFESDFKGLYVAGATAPLSWDFDNLFQKEQLTLKDPDGDGIFETTILLNEEKKNKDLASSWQLTKDIGLFPTFETDKKLLKALYNMSIEEMIKAVEPDSTFRTGKEWAGVWTRDISYSIILSMAYLQPRVAMYSLLRKVKNKKIVQDTGTGGAYPVSTDRMIWAVAAWELYKATGNKDWLEQSYEIVKNSAEDDLQNAHDPITGMVKGESSFLDWREQTYPKWMQPADIFESENLGTNAIHFQAYKILSEMASLLNKTDEAKKYKALSERIKKGINKYLWMKDKGYYGQYVYGDPYKILSPRSEALGEALCVLFDIADSVQKKSIIKNTPQTSFGIPCIYPQIPGIPPYHNNAVWPFVESYWAMAAAKTGNETALLKSISSIYRPAALFLTNKENFVAENGDYKGTEINSSNMLWSLSGNIALVHKILFGIGFEKDGLSFKPFVPKTLNGKIQLRNFRYRNAILNIELEGFGNRIAEFMIDDKESNKYFIPSDLNGTHTIYIRLAENIMEDKIQLVKNKFSPATPTLSIVNNAVQITDKKREYNYLILENGKTVKTSNKINISKKSPLKIYQAIAVDKKNGLTSFASEPLRIIDESLETKYELEEYCLSADLRYKGYSGKGFIEISKEKNTSITIPIHIVSEGNYCIDFRYANGSGPVNTENKCAIRSIFVNDHKIGVAVFPQRGNDEWSNWGYSNSLTAVLKKGEHQIRVVFEETNNNMNGDINRAMLDYLRISQMENKPF